MIESRSKCHSWLIWRGRGGGSVAPLVCVRVKFEFGLWRKRFVKLISKRQKKAVGHQDQKEHILYSLLLQHHSNKNISFCSPTSERAGSVWCCSVLQVSCEHGDTSTLSRLEMVLSCLSYQTRSPVFFLISRFPITSFVIESVFVLKRPGLLDINGSRPSGGLIDS